MKDGEKETIVILDNHEETLIWLSQIFEENGYNVNVATNLEQLMFCLEEEKTDLLVINFCCEVKKKKEIFLKVRGEERYFQIPILGLFRDEPIEVIDLYLELGVDHICTHPFSKKNIRIHAEQLIEAVQTRELIDDLNQKNLFLERENAYLKGKMVRK
ncbi:hypothetical protein QBE53_06955 [Vallitaleaceae bacterium 9-2]